jgi:stress response protein YsnF
VGQNVVDPAKLGLPVYPGASTAEGGGWAMQSKAGGGEMATLTTADTFDKVEAWYKSKMPADSESLSMKSGDTATAMFSVGKETDKEQSSVMINGEKDKTTITLTHQVKKGS